MTPRVGERKLTESARTDESEALMGKLYTNILGDAETALREIAAREGWDRSRAVVYTDPAWPGCEHIPIHGSGDAVAVWSRVAAVIPLVADRLILQMGRNVDPRAMLSAVPLSMKFLTTVTLRMVPPGYRGPLMSGDLAYVFGPARIVRPRRVLPGEIMSNTPKASEREGLEHPCHRSLQHARGIVGHYCQRADVVIDPFSGSCTFGVAALERGLQSINVDSDERWVAEGGARLARTAAQTPILPRSVLEQDTLDLEVAP